MDVRGLTESQRKNFMGQLIDNLKPPKEVLGQIKEIDIKRSQLYNEIEKQIVKQNKEVLEYVYPGATKYLKPGEFSNIEIQAYIKSITDNARTKVMHDIDDEIAKYVDFMGPVRGYNKNILDKIFRELDDAVYSGDSPGLNTLFAPTHTKEYGAAYDLFKKAMYKKHGTPKDDRMDDFMNLRDFTENFLKTPEAATIDKILTKELIPEIKALKKIQEKIKAYAEYTEVPRKAVGFIKEGVDRKVKSTFKFDADIFDSKLKSIIMKFNLEHSIRTAIMDKYGGIYGFPGAASKPVSQKVFRMSPAQRFEDLIQITETGIKNQRKRFRGKYDKMYMTDEQQLQYDNSLRLLESLQKHRDKLVAQEKSLAKEFNTALKKHDNRLRRVSDLLYQKTGIRLGINKLAQALGENKGLMKTTKEKYLRGTITKDGTYIPGGTKEVLESLPQKDQILADTYRNMGINAGDVRRFDKAEMAYFKKGDFDDIGDAIGMKGVGELKTVNLKELLNSIITRNNANKTTTPLPPKIKAYLRNKILEQDFEKSLISQIKHYADDAALNPTGVFDDNLLYTSKLNPLDDIAAIDKVTTDIITNPNGKIRRLMADLDGTYRSLGETLTGKDLAPFESIISKSAQTIKDMKSIDKFAHLVQKTNPLIPLRRNPVETMADIHKNLEKNLARLSKKINLNKERVSAEYGEQIKNFFNVSQGNTPIQKDVKIIIDNVLASEKIDFKTGQLSKTSLYQAITEKVSDDLPGILSSIRVKELISPPEFKALGALLDDTATRVQGIQDLTRRLLAEPAVANEVILPNSDLAYLLLLNRAVTNPNPSTRAIFKQFHFGNPIMRAINSRMQTQATKERLQNQDPLKRIEESKRLEKFNTEVNPQGPNKIPVEYTDVPKGPTHHPISRAYRYFLTENAQSLNRTGFSPAQRIATEISDAQNRLAGETGMSSNLAKEIKALSDLRLKFEENTKMSYNDVNEVIISLDELAAMAGKDKFALETFSREAKSIVSKLPLEVQNYLKQYYDTTWNYASKWNTAVDELLAEVKTNKVFEGLDINIPYVNAKELTKTLETLKINKQDYFRPRMNKVTTVESFEVIAYETLPNGTIIPIRINGNSSVNGIQGIYKVIDKDAKTRINDNEVIYKIHKNEGGSLFNKNPMQPKTKLDSLLADHENLVNINLKTVRNLQKRGTWNVEMFEHNAFIKNPSAIKRNILSDVRDFEDDHMNAFLLYANRMLKHEINIRPVVHADALVDYLAKNKLLDKNGKDMTGTRLTIEMVTNDMLGKPTKDAEVINNIATAIIRPITGKSADIRSLHNFVNKINYLTHFGLDGMNSLVQTLQYGNAVLTSAPKQAIKTGGGYKTMFDVTAYKFANDNKLLTQPGVKKELMDAMGKRFQKMSSKQIADYKAIGEVYEKANLVGNTNGQTYFMMEKAIDDKAIKMKDLTDLGFFDTAFNALTYGFKQGDTIPRKLAINIAYESTDDVLNSLMKKVIASGLDLSANPTIQKSLAVLKANKQSTSVIEKTLLEIIANSSRHWKSHPTKKNYKKIADGKEYKYVANRALKQDFALRFMEDTNHLYNPMNNTQFFNVTSLKALNQFKKYPVKEFNRFVRMAKDGNWGSIAGSLFVLQAVFGIEGMPGAKDLKQMYKGYIGGYMFSKAFAAKNLQIVNEFTTTLPGDKTKDVDAWLNEKAEESDLNRYFLKGATSAFGGVNMTESGSWNISGTIGLRGRVDNLFIDPAGQILFGDVYKRAYNTKNRLVDYFNYNDLRSFQDGEGFLKQLARVAETLQEFIPQGNYLIPSVLNDLGLKPLDNYGVPTDKFQGTTEKDQLLHYAGFKSNAYYNNQTIVNTAKRMQFSQEQKMLNDAYLPAATRIVLNAVFDEKRKLNADEIANLVRIVDIVSAGDGNSFVDTLKNHIMKRALSDMDQYMDKIGEGPAAKKKYVATNIDRILRQIKSYKENRK